MHRRKKKHMSYCLIWTSLSLISAVDLLDQPQIEISADRTITRSLRFNTYPYPTPCDGILNNLDTDQYNPRMIAAGGIEIHAFRRPCQRHNTLFLQDKDVPVQWVVAAPCSPRSFESQRDCGTWPQAEAACSTVPNTPRCTLMSAPCSSSCCTI